MTKRTLKFILVIFGQMVNFVTLSFCPCQLGHSGEVHCSSLNLFSVPNCVPNTTRTLFLNNNNFNSLNSDSFKRFVYLQKLYIENNAIKRLKTGAFDGLRHLELLSLASNDLKYNDSYPNDMFQPLTSLKALHLNGNCNSRIENNCSYPEEALKSAPNLEFLHIDGIKDVLLGDGFKALKRLRHLRMSDNHIAKSHCFLPHIPKEHFYALASSSVEIIELLYCDSNGVEPNVFSFMTNLTTLNVIGNYHMCETGLLNISSGLNITSIRHLKFSEWCRNPDGIFRIRAELSQLLTNTSLETLHIESMNIHFVEPLFNDHLPRSLTELSFRNNKLGSLFFCNNLPTLYNLVSFDISEQGHSHDIKITPGFDAGNKVYTSNKIRGIGGKVVDYPGNKKNTTLSFVNLNLQTSFQYMKLLNMSFNKMGLDLLQTGFNNLTSMKELYLQGNRFGKKIIEHEQLFSGLTELEILNLNDNWIINLPDSIFETLQSLKYLYLANNKLLTVGFSLNKLIHMNVLDLSQNELQSISTENLQFLGNLESINIYLEGNILPCNCSNYVLISWLSKTTNINVLAQNRQLMCKHENNTVIEVQNLEDFLNILSFECEYLKILYIVVSTLIILFLLIALVSVYYHNRWKLTYLYNISKKTVNPYHPIKGSTVTLDIDVYISYDMHFLVKPDWSLHNIVTQYIVPVLNSDGLIVKLRENITPGRCITREIADFIRRSKKIIIFISSECTLDFFNTFEFDTAVIEGVFTRRDATIIVAVGNVENMNIRPELMSVICGKKRGNDIIYLPNDFMKNKELFLEELRAKLIL